MEYGSGSEYDLGCGMGCSSHSEYDSAYAKAMVYDWAYGLVSHSHSEYDSACD